MRNKRENFLITGFACLFFGAMVFFGVSNAAGGILGLTGIALFLIGMSTPSSMEMSAEEVSSWLPSAEKMSEAGKVMYRIDTTLDQPIRTSILCGSCSHIEVVDGKKPAEWACPNCDLQLWLEEEE